MAIEIVNFPINSMVIFQFAMLNYQRVYTTMLVPFLGLSEIYLYDLVMTNIAMV